MEETGKKEREMRSISAFGAGRGEVLLAQNVCTGDGRCRFPAALEQKSDKVGGGDHQNGDHAEQHEGFGRL